MRPDRHDCTWCGSASSIEYGVCQICLMEFPNEAVVIQLPVDGTRGPIRLDRLNQLNEREQPSSVAE